MDSAKAVVLLSGGIDSATTLAIAKFSGFELIALSFDYGQRHKYELKSAQKIANVVGVKQLLVMKIDFSPIGGSALTDRMPVPKGRTDKEMDKGIPITYVPARNTIFLSYALGLAEVKNAQKVFIGANAIDYSGYPDCRPEYMKAFEAMANLATKAAVEGQRISIEAPLISLSKADIITRGIKLGLDYSLTFSCYDPVEDSFACGECDSCILRKRGFAEAGIPDPTKYALKVEV
jgi:7-cyano-7-deazaguanine synthase